MKIRHFLKQLDRPLIEAAIHEAELKTSGEIRVVIQRQPVDDALAAAQAEFVRLGMQNTRQRNAVLILVAPSSQKFAVIGDVAVHARCGTAFWQELAAAMSGHFGRGELSAGLLHGIKRAGQLLAAEFPRHADDRNELPDEVVIRRPVI